MLQDMLAYLYSGTLDDEQWPVGMGWVRSGCWSAPQGQQGLSVRVVVVNASTCHWADAGYMLMGAQR
jgi:hypothetical protein